VYHSGDDQRELNLEDTDVIRQGGHSTLGTGTVELVIMIPYTLPGLTVENLKVF
jgi:hypothetical protein